MSQVPVVRQRSFKWRTPESTPKSEPDKSVVRPTIMGIAASTGGPPALAKVLGALPAEFPIPILLVQHMGPPFMEGFRLLAERPDAARRPHRARSGDPGRGQYLRSAGRPAPAAIGCGNSADQRRSGACQPKAVRDPSVPVHGQGGRAPRPRSDPDRHGRGRRRGSGRDCAVRAAIPWPRTKAPPSSTACRRRPSAWAARAPACPST